MTAVQTEQPKQSSSICSRAVIPAPWCRSTVGCLAQNALWRWNGSILRSLWSAELLIKREQAVLGSPEMSFHLLASQSFIHSFTVQNMWLQWGFKALLIYSFSPDLFKLAPDSYGFTCTPVLCSEVDSLSLSRSRMEGSDCTGGATGQGLFRSAQGLQVVGGGRTCLLVTAKLFTCYCSENCEENQACLWEEGWCWLVRHHFHFLLVLNREYDTCGYGSSFGVSYSTRLPQTTRYCHHPLI